MKKIMLASSSGGHFDQLMVIYKFLKDTYDDVTILTERTKYNKKEKDKYFLSQINRRSIIFPFKFMLNFLYSFFYFLKSNPSIIISTGALATIPICIIGKVFKRKIIFIESYAKTNSPTLTGKLVYKFADYFIVQWEEMKNVYPNSIYLGGIY